MANSYVYDSYGRTLTVFESTPQPFTYTGRELDSESGLYYYRARYYDAQTGRFLSEDPIRFDGGDGNLYRYVRNNPVNLIDPQGTLPPLVDPNAPAFDPGFSDGGGGGGPEPFSNEFNPLDNPVDFTAQELIDGFLRERAKELIEKNFKGFSDALERARNRMNEQTPDNPQREIICP